MMVMVCTIVTMFIIRVHDCVLSRAVHVRVQGDLNVRTGLTIS